MNMLFISWLPVHPMASARSFAASFVESIRLVLSKQLKDPDAPSAEHWAAHTELGHATTCVAVLRSSSDMMFSYVSAQVWSVGFGMSFPAPQGCCE